MKKLTLITSLMIFISLCSMAVVRNVPGSYTTIQSAILASNNGDTVLVDAGTYFENLNFRGKKIVVTSRFYINNDLSYITNTIINGSTPTQPDSASCVIFNNGEDSTTVLQGFTLTGGMGTKWQDIHAAGRFTEGGGILIELSSPIIQFNIIRNNSAVNTSGVTSAGGGGIRIGDGNPKILNNVITYNTGIYGAGIVLNYTGVTIKNNVIAGNFGSYSYGAGSGIWCYSNLGTTPKIIENNTIVNNSATTAGTGGIYIGAASNVSIKNNIIWGNFSNGGTIQINGGLSSAINYNDIMGGWTTGSGNMDVNPGFSDTNYILSVTSQVIDKGDSSTVYNDPGTGGIASYPSRGTTRNDMGAYGGPGRKILSSSPIGIIPNTQTAKEFTLYQNYPNPFNPSTVIRFVIPAKAGIHVDNVQLQIYNSIGQIIESKSFSVKQNNYEFTWNASRYSSGIYFYSLLVDGAKIDTKKMILVR